MPGATCFRKFVAKQGKSAHHLGFFLSDLVDVVRISSFVALCVSMCSAQRKRVSSMIMTPIKSENIVAKAAPNPLQRHSHQSRVTPDL